jgi:hypothetical protein
MENKEISSIDLLVTYMEENFHLTEGSRELFKKVKEMHKHEITYAFNKSILEINNNSLSASEYYKQKFGNNNN